MQSSTKAELLDKIAASRSQLESAIGGLTEGQLATPGPDGWSIKDHLAHLSAWEESLIALIQGRDRDAAIGWPGGGGAAHDVDAINAAIQKRSKDRSLADTLAQFGESHGRVIATLNRLSDEDLTRPYSHFQPNDPPFNPNPVIGWIAGNTYEHYDEHREWIEKLRGTLPPGA